MDGEDSADELRMIGTIVFACPPVRGIERNAKQLWCGPSVSDAKYTYFFNEA